MLIQMCSYIKFKYRSKNCNVICFLSVFNFLLINVRENHLKTTILPHKKVLMF